jgi:hypothetical protein
MLVQPEGFAHDAADAVALDGIAGRAHGNRHAESRAMLVVAACCHREESVAKTPPARVRSVELRLASQSLVRRKSEPVHSLWAEGCRGGPILQTDSFAGPVRPAPMNAEEPPECRMRQTQRTWDMCRLPLWRRPVTGSASAGPWRGGGPAPCGRSGSPCVPGTHACACGAAC